MVSDRPNIRYPIDRMRRIIWYPIDRMNSHIEINCWYPIDRVVWYPIDRMRTGMDPLLPDRYPNRDFFVADILDAMPKDDMASMEHPMFSLATQPDLKPRYYERNGNSITITPSILGLATIWDKDILIYCISQLMAGINMGRKPSQIIRITAHDLLVSTNRETGGVNYKRLVSAFQRLQGTNIKTSIMTNGETITRGFGLIEWWEIIEKSDVDDRMIGIEVKLSDWLYNAVLGTELLTINREYFRLRGGLERRLYEIARKHCGSQARWSVGVNTLFEKSGAKSTKKLFKSRVKKIASANVLPDYLMSFNAEKNLLIFYNRKGNKAAKTQFDDQVKMLFNT